MKNRLFYLVGAAFFVFSTSMFTSCINGVDDEYLELQGSGNGETTGDEEEEDLPDLSGEYYEGGEYELKMTYNGEELTGKKVTFLPDDKNETAVIELAGTEIDLASLNSLLAGMNATFTTSSPIPGEKTVVLNDVKLYGNGSVYKFDGEDITPVRIVKYRGTVEEGKMSIDITHELVNQELAGTWNLAPVQNLLGCVEASPLWIDWDTKVEIDPGKIPNGDSYITGLNQNPNGLFSTLFWVGEPDFAIIFGFELQIQRTVLNLLQGVTAQPDGCMFATYSYSGDTNNPLWSSEMSRNIIRYYYGEPNQIYIEANADFLMKTIGGLLNPTRAADPEQTKAIGKKLVEALTPALEKGFPCNYVLNNNKLTINLDGEFTVKLLRVLAELLNDEVANEFIMAFLESDPTLAAYATNVKTLIKTLPNALKYHDGNEKKGFTGECTYVKIGLRLERQ